MIGQQKWGGPGGQERIVLTFHFTDQLRGEAVRTGAQNPKLWVKLHQKLTVGAWAAPGLSPAQPSYCPFQDGNACPAHLSRWIMLPLIQLVPRALPCDASGSTDMGTAGSLHDDAVQTAYRCSRQHLTKWGNALQMRFLKRRKTHIHRCIEKGNQNYKSKTWPAVEPTLQGTSARGESACRSTECLLTASSSPTVLHSVKGFTYVFLILASKNLCEK